MLKGMRLKPACPEHYKHIPITGMFWLKGLGKGKRHERHPYQAFLYDGFVLSFQRIRDLFRAAIATRCCTECSAWKLSTCVVGFS